MNPAGLDLLITTLYARLTGLHAGSPFDALGGLTMGPDPFIYGLAVEGHRHGLQPNPFQPLVVRKQAKDHGTGQKIEGFYKAGQQVLLVDDVITTAGSSIKALDSLRAAGLKVEAAFCLVDREEGGYEALAELGVTLHSLYKKSDFVEEGRPGD